ncbi:hypothetical protein GCM10020295_29630 [Streptomyces cinereospinus]
MPPLADGPGAAAEVPGAGLLAAAGAVAGPPPSSVAARDGVTGPGSSAAGLVRSRSPCTAPPEDDPEKENPAISAAAPTAPTAPAATATRRCRQEPGLRRDRRGPGGATGGSSRVSS